MPPQWHGQNSARHTSVTLQSREEEINIENQTYERWKHTKAKYKAENGPICDCHDQLSLSYDRWMDTFMESVWGGLSIWDVWQLLHQAHSWDYWHETHDQTLKW